MEEVRDLWRSTLRPAVSNIAAHHLRQHGDAATQDIVWMLAVPGNTGLLRPSHSHYARSAVGTEPDPPKT